MSCGPRWRRNRKPRIIIVPFMLHIHTYKGQLIEFNRSYRFKVGNTCFRLLPLTKVTLNTSGTLSKYFRCNAASAKGSASQLNYEQQSAQN